MLAKRAGIELEAEDRATARVRSEKEAIYHANDVAARWFHRVLVAEAGGEPGRALLRRTRHQRRETIERSGSASHPTRWDGLVDALQREGVDLALAAKAGLVKPGQRGYYDFYRDRLMIPTRAVTGEVIAFGGRLIGEGEPKYLNTTTTPVYTKGRFLFALGHRAPRRAARGRDRRSSRATSTASRCTKPASRTPSRRSGTAFTAEQAQRAAQGDRARVHLLRRRRGRCRRRRPSRSTRCVAEGLGRAHRARSRPARTPTASCARTAPTLFARC